MKQELIELKCKNCSGELDIIDIDNGLVRCANCKIRYIVKAILKHRPKPNPIPYTFPSVPIWPQPEPVREDYWQRVSTTDNTNYWPSNITITSNDLSCYNTTNNVTSSVWSYA